MGCEEEGKGCGGTKIVPITAARRESRSRPATP